MKKLLPALILVSVLLALLAACVAIPVQPEEPAGAAAGTLTIGTFVNFTEQFDAPTVTNGSTITMTTSFVPLTAAGAVGTSAIVGCETSGRLSFLYNTADQTITLTDTGTLLLAGNFGMTQYDMLILLGDGESCVEVSRSVN